MRGHHKQHPSNFQFICSMSPQMAVCTEDFHPDSQEDQTGTSSPQNTISWSLKRLLCAIITIFSCVLKNYPKYSYVFSKRNKRLNELNVDGPLGCRRRKGEGDVEEKQEGREGFRYLSLFMTSSSPQLGPVSFSPKSSKCSVLICI